MKHDDRLNFHVIITQEENGYVASVPAIPGCHSQGETYEEVQSNIREAIELCLEVAEHDVEYKNKIDFPTISSFL